MGERLGLAVWDGKEKAFFYSHWGGTELSFISIVAEGIIFGKAKDTKSFVEAMKPYHDEIKPIKKLHGEDIEYFGVIDFTYDIAAKTGVIAHSVREEFAMELEAKPNFDTWHDLISRYWDFELSPMVVVDLEPKAIVEKFGELLLLRIEHIESVFKSPPHIYTQSTCNWFRYYNKLVKAVGESRIHSKVVEKASEFLSRRI